ncbi:MFS transporter [Pseudonocardia oroxyli]|uniref:Drug resistance transporter, EmrB/QacA subfamily n=1 Tax=Pseudonocardia oroxyli TaxID=366584 RepID=A0A1G7INZ2_PSEOR|nr:MFS transporter [Pseudonocardia oroxyli]SDF14266.1 drug resistance transporter, EmrB/QacA subfamily [Pseudonocardia oroxyli]
MTSTETYTPDPRRWRALSVTLAAGFMSLLDVSIVSVALPSIQQGLGTNPAGAQWVVSGYALTFGLALVPAGRLGDAFGRRRMFLIALTAFVLFSAACGAAPTIGLLVVARLLQGLAAGCLAPQNSGLIQNLFRGAERGRAFGFFGATVGISTAAGPIVGGLLLAAFGEPDGWRWIFYVNVPIGVLAVVLAARLVPRVGTGGDRKPIDWTGAALLGAAVLALLFPLVQAESGGVARYWWLFPIGAVPAGAFLWWERRELQRRQEPLLDLRLITETSGYASGALIGMVYFTGFSGVWIVFAQFFQSGLGYTPLQSGLSVTAFAVGSAVSAVVAGKLVERYGRRLTVFGLSLVTLGIAAAAVILLLVPGDVAGLCVAPALLVAGIGGGFVISPNITMTLRNVPVRMAGSAGGALQTGQRVGAAIGTALVAGVFYGVLAAAGNSYPAAIAGALALAVLTTVVALAVAVADLRHAGGGTVPEPSEHHVSHD